MDEYNDTPEKDVNEQVKEKAAEVKKQVVDNVTELKAKLSTEDQVVNYCKTNALQLITTVAVVGILINNRRSLKFSKRVIKNMDKNMRGAQETIEALRSAGQNFTFYPGVGIYVE